MDSSAKARKRAACSALVSLAKDVELATERRHRDLGKADFEEFFRAVSLACRSPQQQQRAERARKAFFGEGVETLSLPQVPELPGNPQPAQVPTEAEPTEGALPGVGGDPQHMKAGADGLSEVVHDEDGKKFRLRGKSCLFTYNSKVFGALAKEKLWESFITFITALNFVSAWTATMEESTKSTDPGRIHLHLFVEFISAVDWTSLRKMVFLGSTPNAEPTVARGPKQREAIDQGHFYAWANKVGTLHVETSGYVPWTDYVVRGWWLDQLWTQHKITNKVYMEYAAKVRLGFVARQRQVEALENQDKLLRLRERQAQVAHRLVGLRRPFKPEVLDALKPWAQQYSADAMRFSFLVLRGGSRTGKSTLAKSIGDSDLFNFGKPFIQTVQNVESPDLRDFSDDQHGYILFDNVNDMKFILDFRALIQANNDIHVLGESKTGMYSYPVWIYRIPVVVTVDMTAKWDTDEPWIKENCFHIFLDGPSYMS